MSNKWRKLTMDDISTIKVDDDLRARDEALAAKRSKTDPKPPGPLFSPAPAPPPVLEPSKFEPLTFADPSDLFLLVNRTIAPYAWQTELQMLIGGYTPNGDKIYAPTVEKPMILNVVAANGSGKDKTIIAATAAWFCCTKVQSKCVITSNSYVQLKSNTFDPLETLCLALNDTLGEKVFEVIEFYITCKRTGSYIKLICSDDPAKIEGQHSELGGEFMMIINEAKSPKEEIMNAFDRFTGWNYWIMISSTGDMSGRFYRTTVTAKHVHPAPLVLGERYVRKITAFDCPHLLVGPRIQQIINDHGKESVIYRSSIMSEFCSYDESAMISGDSLIYKPPTKSTLGMPRVAGLDIGLGGDPTVLDIWQGNHRVAVESTNISDASVLHFKLIEWFKRHGLEAKNITADYGGIGRPIVHRLAECGWAIRHINNESVAFNKKDYKNRGAELWYKLKRLIEEKLLVLPIVEHGEAEDMILRYELVGRRYSIESGRIKIETKPEMRSRGASSPNRADAMALAFAYVSFDDIRLTPPVTDPTMFDIPQTDAEIEALYKNTARHTYGARPNLRAAMYADNHNGTQNALLCN